MEVAGVAHPLRKDAHPFLLSLLGGEELREAAVPLLPPASCTAEAWLLGHKVRV